MPTKFAALKRLRWIAANKIEYREHFDMAAWFAHTGPHEMHMKDGQPDPRGCGTTACLAGWALSDPVFRKLTGLKLARFFFHWEPSGSLRRALGIDYDSNSILFYSENKATPREQKRAVLKRIDAVLKARGDYSKIPNPERL